MNLSLLKDVTKDLGPERWMQVIAAVLTGLLLLLLLVGWIWVLRMPPAPVVLPDPNALRAQELVIPDRQSLVRDYVVADDAGSDGDEEHHEGLAERPLFWISRRPAAEQVAEVSQEPAGRNRRDEFSQVKLEGVYFAGDNSGVIVTVGEERIRVRLKEELLGWTLVSLDANSAVFARGEQEQRSLQLEHALLPKYTATSPSRPRQAPAAVKSETTQ